MSEPQNPGQDDPDATIFVAPSGRKAFQRSALQTDATVLAAEGKSLDLDALGGVNPLVAAANPLLSLVPQLRSSVTYPNPAGLRDVLLRQISSFEKSARDGGVSPEHVLVARYALCTLVDESVSLTPWGNAAQWARTSLLVTLHKETGGGEKFFLLLGKLVEDPAKNINLLELMYVCLALGYEGRYRVVDNGKAQLEPVRERLYEVIRKQRGEVEHELSPHWKGLQTTTGRSVRFLPLWLSASVAALVLVGVFIWLSIALNQRSDGLFSTLAKLKVPAPPAPKATVVAKPVQPRLSQFLADDIKKGTVDVREDETTSVVTIRGDGQIGGVGLFAAGSSTIEPAYEDLIRRIAEALNKVPGQVLVTGHSDDQPIRTARFPSNWHLSQERATSVLRMIAQRGTEQARLKAEGLADAQPIAPNDSPANRARNRRVEIVLRVANQ